jgi:hypothetical protein
MEHSGMEKSFDYVKDLSSEGVPLEHYSRDDDTSQYVTKNLPFQLPIIYFVNY